MSSKARSSATDPITELRRTLDRLVSETHKPSPSPTTRRKLEAEIKAAVETLGQFLSELDPIKRPAAVFDPGNPKVVGRFIALAMVAQKRQPLASFEKHYGSGVYAIYYNGPFALYAPIKGTETPIHVGQAAPAISNARTPTEQGERLCRRLEDHRKNISKAKSTLDIADFEFRSLVVQSGWETAAEDYLIHLFQPIWNNETKILYGLGKHGDAATTRANKRSPWDTLHPGRTLANSDRITDAKTKKEIAHGLQDHFKRHPVLKNLEHVMGNFIEELRQV